MKDDPKVFLDTNLLIYAHTNVEVRKQLQMQQIIGGENTFISTQVFKEVANVLHKKFRFGWNEIRQVLQEMEQNSETHINSHATIQQACLIAERYKFSFYDSLIIAAALECECAMIYSEDMQHGQVIENTLTVRNPFV